MADKMLYKEILDSSAVLALRDEATEELEDGPRKDFEKKLQVELDKDKLLNNDLKANPQLEYEEGFQKKKKEIQINKAKIYDTALANNLPYLESVKGALEDELKKIEETKSKSAHNFTNERLTPSNIEQLKNEIDKIGNVDVIIAKPAQLGKGVLLGKEVPGITTLKESVEDAIKVKIVKDGKLVNKLDINGIAINMIDKDGIPINKKDIKILVPQIQSRRSHWVTNEITINGETGKVTSNIIDPKSGWFVDKIKATLTAASNKNTTLNQISEALGQKRGFIDKVKATFGFGNIKTTTEFTGVQKNDIDCGKHVIAAMKAIKSGERPTNDIDKANGQVTAVDNALQKSYEDEYKKIEDNHKKLKEDIPKAISQINDKIQEIQPPLPSANKVRTNEISQTISPPSSTPKVVMPNGKSAGRG